MSARPLRLTDVEPVHQTENRRRHGRVRTAEVLCTLGEVLDISGSGMRIRGKGKPPVSKGQSACITLATPAGLLALDISISWARRVSWRHYEVGVAFVSVTPDVSEGIKSVLRGAQVSLTGYRPADGRGGDAA